MNGFTITLLFDVGPNLLSKWSILMATLADFTTKLDALQVTIDAVKQEIADLKAQVASGGLTAEEEQQVLDQIDAKQASLAAAQ